MKSIKKITALTGLLILLIGCKTTQKTNIQQASSAISESTKIIERVIENQPKFFTANINKMSIKLNYNGRELSVMSSCKIRKDSLIHLSIQFFGRELFKGEFSVNNVRVFDKMNNNLYEATYAEMSNYAGVNIDYYSLQNLLFNQFFCIGQKDINTSKCKIITNQNGVEILFTDKDVEQSTTINLLNKIEKVTIKKKDNPHILKAVYSDFFKDNNISYPKQITVSAGVEDKISSVEFSILRCAFDIPLKFSDMNTNGFTKADIFQLLNK